MQGRLLEHFEGDLVAVAVQSKGYVRIGCRGAMLDGEGELVTWATPQVEIGVSPGVKLRAAPQGLAWS